MSGVVAKCQTCLRPVKGSLKVTSNFIHHLRKQHPKAFQKFKTVKSETRRQKVTKPDNFNQKLLNFICASCSPLSVVECEEFKELFPNKTLPSRRTITRLLNETFNAFTNDIERTLSRVNYVCTTADVWSGGKRSFLGVTCHWLDARTFRRNSVALSCRRFKGSHSFDKVMDLLLDIYGQYNLTPEKIGYTITDNGSNFIKAFKEFGVPLKKYDGMEELEDGTASNDDSDDEDGPSFIPINPRSEEHTSELQSRSGFAVFCLPRSTPPLLHSFPTRRSSDLTHIQTHHVYGLIPVFNCL